MNGIKAEIVQAIRSGNVEGVKNLLDRGFFFAPGSLEFAVPSDAKDRDGEEPTMESPLGIAGHKGHAEIVRMLLRIGADPLYSPDQNLCNAFHDTCKGRSAECALMMLDKLHVVLSSRTSTQWTPLHFAAAYGGVEVVDALVRCPSSLSHN